MIEKEKNYKYFTGIRGRLLIGFTSICFIFISAAAVTLVATNNTKDFAKHLVDIDLPDHSKLLNLRKAIYDMHSSTQSFIITHDSSFKNKVAEYWTVITDLSNSIDNASKKTWATKDINQWNETKILLKELHQKDNQLFTAKFEDKNSVDIYYTILELHQKIVALIHDDKNSGLDNIHFAKILDDNLTLIDYMKKIEFTLLSLLSLAVVSSVIISLLTARRIINPLQYAIDIAKKIASGNRNLVISSFSKDETGQLLDSLNTMQHSINNNEQKIKLAEQETRLLFDNVVEKARLFSALSGKVAAGDLTQRLTLNDDSELASLGRDLNTMTEGLANITKKIIEAAKNMDVSLDGVKNISNQQSASVSEQASSINEITASLGEIDKSSAQTMEKAKILGKLAESTSEEGEFGLKAVDESISGMNSIRLNVKTITNSILDLSKQTQQVGEITAVVNTLAQQSKMLALNASIEAAKAGEAGKGFAVVASEIKNLAEQSERSTIEVQKILESIRHATEKAVLATEEGAKGVENGTKLVEEMGKVVNSLTNAIHETMIASQQIEAAVRQENLGIEQITLGMNEINQVTSSFVSTVTQTTQSIHELSSIAKNIREYVAVYHI